MQSATSLDHGGSRAAKKRAKKKHKEQQPVHHHNDDDDDVASSGKHPKKIRVESSSHKNSSDEKNKNAMPSSKDPVIMQSQDPNVPAESILHFLNPEDSSVPASIQSTILGLTAKERARSALAFLLRPADITVDEFHKTYWEKKPLLVQSSSKGHRHRFDGLLSLESIRQMIHERPMAYGRDLNVTKYTTDPATGIQRRLTLDRLPEKQNNGNTQHKDDDEEEEEKEFIVAEPGEVWKHFNKGCTIRLLCPHEHADNVQSLLSLLELEWGNMVGANAYLTPPDSSQGFAPHYDDIEAFCLQLSGRKRWKVYPPFPAEKLPRVSSRDYTPEDLEDIKPVMDIILGPGDMLYMPRGWIHEACTLEPGSRKGKDDGHSLHLTVSAMQQWAWVDLLEVLLPEALTAAANSEVSTALREGLPRNFLDYMGAIHDDSKQSDVLKAAQKSEDNEEVSLAIKNAQETFRAEAKNRIMRVAKEAMDMLDAACDQMGKQFISSCQPPALTPREKKTTALAQSAALRILPDMMVRLVRPGIARLVLEDGMAVLYHCMDNSRVYHGKPLSPMEFEMDDAPAIEQLLKTLEPHWICVSDLFHDTLEDKVGVVQSLFDEGILSVKGMEEDR